ncbi:uncharacterized protein LOC132799134 [Ziziphus jujuba]|uniref:Uncharacterized protein LOC132799134 n=1 Tax=Ziziphus jujuba TaxID=326968 RepID=A0A6P4A0K1_ZIZJJ|nr:uncharacterized protein LOC132799134 [Ziziphus jujuba]
MRLQSIDSDINKDELKTFSKWISIIGDETIDSSNDGHAMIDIPDDLLIKDIGNSVASIVNSTSDLDIDLIGDLYTPKFLNAIKCSGVPNHQLKLKISIPIMLLRNVDHSSGLCNGTRLVITRLGNHVLEGKLVLGSNVGFKVLISRITLTPWDPRLHFQFQRRQYHLVVSYAMTINKSQDQFLSHVRLYLKQPIFNHGQLYVAVSKVTNRKGLKILIYNKDGEPTNSTTNVVLKEVFQNLD